jgi:hypothetical protein
MNKNIINLVYLFVIILSGCAITKASDIRPTPSEVSMKWGGHNPLTFMKRNWGVNEEFAEKAKNEEIESGVFIKSFNIDGTRHLRQLYLKLDSNYLRDKGNAFVKRFHGISLFGASQQTIKEWKTIPLDGEVRELIQDYFFGTVLLETGEERPLLVIIYKKVDEKNGMTFVSTGFQGIKFLPETRQLAEKMIIEK